MEDLRSVVFNHRFTHTQTDYQVKQNQRTQCNDQLTLDHRHIRSLSLTMEQNVFNIFMLLQKKDLFLLNFFISKIYMLTFLVLPSIRFKFYLTNALCSIHLQQSKNISLIIEPLIHRDQLKQREREQTCPARALHAIDPFTWVQHQLKAKSQCVLKEQKII